MIRHFKNLRQKTTLSWHNKLREKVVEVVPLEILTPEITPTEEVSRPRQDEEGSTARLSINRQWSNFWVDALNLQQFLNKEGFVLTESGPGSLGNETTYFGP